MGSGGKGRKEEKDCTSLERESAYISYHFKKMIFMVDAEA